MPSTTTVLHLVDAHLREWFPRHLPAHFVFHNFHHAQSIAGMVTKLADKEGLSEDDTEILSLAAWFLFTGMHDQDTENYRVTSVREASRFLSSLSYPSNRINQVCDLILSTGPSELPVSEAEKILDDAIHAYLGGKDFFSKVKLLRLEKEAMNKRAFTEKQWSEFLLSHLLNHNYFTDWAKRKLGKRKLRHIAAQKENNLKAQERTLKKKTGKNLGRGVDTLYRTTFRNHINLSQIADGKANMMISINTIVLSILIAASGAGFSFLGNALAQDFYLLLPLLLLLCSSLTALVFAVFSAKPTITNFKLPKKNPSEFNLLFFGNFLQLPKDGFVNYLSDLKRDQNRLYDDMARDLYQLGIVLRKKYRLLSLSYNIFVGGLILAVTSFAFIYLL